MAWLRRKRFEDPSGDPLARLPRITQPSKTQHITQLARESMPADEHWTHTQVLTYLELLRDRNDAPLYLGVSGRPAILLRLSGQMRTGLDGLGELIERKGAELFLQGHRLTRYGMVRAVLQLPEYDLIFETPLTLAHGDVQEFVSAAYRTETVELHLGHVNEAQSLQFVCQAAGVRPVVEATVDAIHDLRHPTTPEEQDGPVSALEAKFPKISSGLTSRTRIRLAATGPADGVVKVETLN